MDHTPLYLRPDFASVADRLDYPDEDRRRLNDFARDGYVVIDVDIANIDTFADEVIGDLAPLYSEDGRIMDGWRNSAGAKALACNREVLRILNSLYGRPAFPFQTLNFNRGTEQETHCDTIHFDSQPHGFMAGVWVALEDIDANNGPLHYFAGSHRLPHVSLAEAGATSDNGFVDYNTHYLPMLDKIITAHGFERREGHIRKGQAVIWAANLAHGGSRIRQEGRSRHSQVTHYYFDDCGYFTPLMSDPFLGKVFVREPIDICSGKARVSRYAGRDVPAERVDARGRLRRAADRVLDSIGAR